jgi:putative transcriptional regulator
MNDLDQASDHALLKDLCDRLRTLRKRRGWTQAGLAEQAGLSRMTVVRLERGDSVHVMTLIQVLRALGDLESLRALVEPPPPSPMQALREQRGGPSGT